MFIYVNIRGYNIYIYKYIFMTGFVGTLFLCLSFCFSVHSHTQIFQNITVVLAFELADILGIRTLVSYYLLQLVKNLPAMWET